MTNGLIPWESTSDKHTRTSDLIFKAYAVDHRTRDGDYYMNAIVDNTVIIKFPDRNDGCYYIYKLSHLNKCQEKHEIEGMISTESDLDLFFASHNVFMDGNYGHFVYTSSICTNSSDGYMCYIAIYPEPGIIRCDSTGNVLTEAEVIRIVNSYGKVPAYISMNELNSIVTEGQEIVEGSKYMGYKTSGLLVEKSSGCYLLRSIAIDYDKIASIEKRKSSAKTRKNALENGASYSFIRCLSEIREAFVDIFEKLYSYSTDHRYKISLDGILYHFPGDLEPFIEYTRLTSLLIPTLLNVTNGTPSTDIELRYLLRAAKTLSSANLLADFEEETAYYVNRAKKNKKNVAYIEIAQTRTKLLEALKRVREHALIIADAIDSHLTAGTGNKKECR